MFSFKNLLKAYYQCRKTKRKSSSATEFELNFEKELLKMSLQLKNRNYRLGKYTCFAITDPKLREVWAADFRDRVLHHLLVDRLEQIWEKKFIFHSYACRSEKGAHKAIKYLKNAIPAKLPYFPLIKGVRPACAGRRIFSSKSDKIQPLFYLQVDIESFFMSIDKSILFSIVQKHINNPDILWLTKLIIFQNPTDNYLVKGDRKILASIPKHKSLFYVPPSQGLPIGNYTSQFFANVYLNEIDQFIKHHLKCRFYFRYMDDFLLLHEDKNLLLKWRDEISGFLESRLKLALHPKKQFLQPVSHGINFLGYIVRPNYVLSRRRIVANFKKKLYYFNKLLNGNTRLWPEQQNFQLALPLIFPNQIPTQEFIQKVQATVNSYYGHFKHANCSSLRKNLHQGYFKELKNFLEPADKTFSFFIINPAIKKFYQEKNQDY